MRVGSARSKFSPTKLGTFTRACRRASVAIHCNRTSVRVVMLVTRLDNSDIIIVCPRKRAMLTDQDYAMIRALLEERAARRTQADSDAGEALLRGLEEDEPPR